MLTTKYQVTVDLPTAKEFVEIPGLGLFRNKETTVLSDEQVERWYNQPRSAGGDPLAVFPRGIVVEEVPAPKPKDKAPETAGKADTGEGDA